MVRVQVGQEYGINVFQIGIALDGSKGTAAQVQHDLPASLAVVGSQEITRRG
jgi:hypothetical protein